MKNPNQVRRILTALLLVVIALFFTLGGRANAYIKDGDLVMKGTFYSETVPLAEIDAYELRDSFDPGERSVGVGLLSYLAGSFQNDEFGEYRLLMVKSAPCFLLVRSGDEVYALGLKDGDKTRALLAEIEENK